MRTRPFVLFNHSTCRPEDENTLRKMALTPSGHTAYGTPLALVLSEARPNARRSSPDEDGSSGKAEYMVSLAK